jgi:hypothetical protein
MDNSLEARLDKLIKELVGRREEVVEQYLDALSGYSALEGSLDAVRRAGILHDLDKHITNLEMEMKRLAALSVMPSLAVIAHG